MASRYKRATALAEVAGGEEGKGAGDKEDGGGLGDLGGGCVWNQGGGGTEVGTASIDGAENHYGRCEVVEGSRVALGKCEGGGDGFE